MPSPNNWMKGTFPEWIVVGLTGVVAYFCAEFVKDNKEFRKETEARISVLERQQALLEQNLRINDALVHELKLLRNARP